MHEERPIPDYTQELPEVVAVYCWKVNRMPDKTYLIFYDKTGRMYRSAMDGFRFTEKCYYAIRPLHTKLKISKSQKPYIAIGGIHIETRLTKEEYCAFDDLETLLMARSKRYAWREEIAFAIE